MTEMRRITKEEWNQHEWVNVTCFGDYLEGRMVFVKAEPDLPPDPPDDGCVYIPLQHRWVPAFTPPEPPEVG